MDPHLDAERLAAFMDGSISRRERAEIERHAADCAGCMQQLALMARTTAEVTARTAAVPRFMRWAVPAAVAATAVAVWINVGGSGREGATSMRVEPAAPTTEGQSAPEAASGVHLDRQAGQAPVAVPNPPSEQPRREVRKDRLPGAPQAKAGSLPVQEPAASVARSGAAAPGAPSAEAAAVSPPPQPAPVDSAHPLAETVEPERRELVRRAPDDADLFEVPSPDPSRRWRVRGRLLERSLDAGRTWQLLPPALTVQLVAGSAPSPDVVWLVGRGGAVVRMTDGEGRRRVPFPDTADLTAVKAVSAREAEVTTADGRHFRTADGGLTWTLQEAPAPSF